ncbi:MAG TPA: glycosyltransferase [Steroidobacteraceae bacterium]|nr:glycosyltransferase [Steroidobacteraceae bacterium]
MHFVLFYHSLISDWNHGNAHFLRGVATELQAQGHAVSIYEPADGWSLRNLRENHGDEPIAAFHAAYPQLRSTLYDPAALDLDVALDGADVVIVHEWNDPALVRRIGAYRRHCGRFTLLFHDTHHRAVSAPREIRAFDLSSYDGVLAFGAVLRQIYEDHGLAARAWTWHEAADTRRFTPALRQSEPNTDLVWVGNWGDGERAAEITRFLIEPAHALRLRARVYGVRYPEAALAALHGAGIAYGGWAPNFRVPEIFANAAVTVHIPRRFYAESLPGIPTIRMFEALACGIPLVSTPWDDCENLFRPGHDYLVAGTAAQMREHLRLLRACPHIAQATAGHGLQTILSRHTCAHRVAELLAICESLGAPALERMNRPPALPLASDQHALQPGA